jgi:hypothetical protein
MDLQFRAPSITAFQTTSASCGTVTVTGPDTGNGTNGGDTGDGTDDTGNGGTGETGAGGMMAGLDSTTVLVLVIVAAAAAYTVSQA